MTWLLVIGLAGAAFAFAAFAFRLPRSLWATLGTALVLGLAGFALQARTDLAGAPARAHAQDAQLGSALI
ncbi:MAG: cytochrome C biosynthesis protein, partial [Croceibacterium sp.]